MLVKNWHDAVTWLYAAEADAIGKNFQGALTPGAYDWTGFEMLIWTGTTVTAGDLGDAKLYSAIATMDTWYSQTINLLTAGEAGGPVDAGTYDIYIDAKAVDAGGGAMEYRAWLRFAATGSLDETIYLVLGRAMVWDGAGITVVPTVRTDLHGTVDVPRVGAGYEFAAVLADSDRGAWIDELADVTVDENAAINFIGAAEIIADVGNLSIDLGINSTVLLGTNAQIELAGANASLVCDAAAYIQVFGQLLLDDGSLNYIKDGAWLFVDEGVVVVDDGGQLMLMDGSTMQWEDGDPPAASPAQNEMTGASFAKAWALVHSDGTILASLNVNAVNHVALSGVYALTFQRNFAAANYAVTPVANSGPAVANSSAWNIAGFTVTTVNLAGAATDAGFSVAVFGGDQA